MDTLQGMWNYTYDDLGQLTGWTAPTAARPNTSTMRWVTASRLPETA